MMLFSSAENQDLLSAHGGTHCDSMLDPPSAQLESHPRSGSCHLTGAFLPRSHLGSVPGT